MIRKLCCLCFCLLLCTLAQAQTESFIRHKVRRMETIYSISRKYNVDMDLIISVNGLTGSEISKGRILIIPLGEESLIPKKADVVKGENLFVHIVKEGETAEFLSEKYLLSVSEIRNLNPDAFSRGQIIQGCAILLPRPSSQPQEDIISKETGKKDLNDCKSYVRDPAHQHIVSLLLPFHAADGPTTQNRPYFEFYRGALMAAEQMKSKGMNLKLHCLDVSAVPAGDLAETSPYKESELLIGPVFKNLIAPYIGMLSESAIKIISPLDPASASLVTAHPRFIQVQPDDEIRNRSIISCLDPQKGDIWLISESGANDPLVASYTKILNQSEIPFQTFEYGVLQGRETTARLEEMMKTIGINQVLVASENEAFVSDVLRNLHLLLAYKTIPIEVFGTASWRHFETLDLQAMHRLQTQIALPVYADYNNPFVKEFVLAYRRLFNKEPDVYAFQAYDICFYFFSALYELGPGFENCIETFSLPGLLQSDYHFVRQSPEDGFSNTGCRIIRYLPDFSISLK